MHSFSSGPLWTCVVFRITVKQPCLLGSSSSSSAIDVKNLKSPAIQKPAHLMIPWKTAKSQPRLLPSAARHSSLAKSNADPTWRSILDSCQYFCLTRGVGSASMKRVCVALAGLFFEFLDPSRRRRIDSEREREREIGRGGVKAKVPANRSIDVPSDFTTVHWIWMSLRGDKDGTVRSTDRERENGGGGDLRIIMALKGWQVRHRGGREGALAGEGQSQQDRARRRRTEGTGFNGSLISAPYRVGIMRFGFGLLPL